MSQFKSLCRRLPGVFFFVTFIMPAFRLVFQSKLQENVKSPKSFPAPSLESSGSSHTGGDAASGFPPSGRGTCPSGTKEAERVSLGAACLAQGSPGPFAPKSRKKKESEAGITLFLGLWGTPSSECVQVLAFGITESRFGPKSLKLQSQTLKALNSRFSRRAVGPSQADLPLEPQTPAPPPPSLPSKHDCELVLTCFGPDSDPNAGMTL